jgi:hypothetical protein
MPRNRTQENQSHPDWGHTWQDHGSQLSVSWHRNRANGQQNNWTDRTRDPQQGFWTNNQQAAEHILSQNLYVGHNEIRIPHGMGRVVFPDGRVVDAQVARVIVNPNGTIDTAYPTVPRTGN